MRVTDSEDVGNPKKVKILTEPIFPKLQLWKCGRKTRSLWEGQRCSYLRSEEKAGRSAKTGWKKIDRKGREEGEREEESVSAPHVGRAKCGCTRKTHRDSGVLFLPGRNHIANGANSRIFSRM
ncbi:hypothetical protein B0H19DRAFT_1057000 [Mycena capillaripes]|nr:hypothetical protein B0H19DRAFT_1057000 [Mycena capillaripes]